MVALDGDVALIGSLWDDDNGFNSCSAYLFALEDTPEKVPEPGGLIALGILGAISSQKLKVKSNPSRSVENARSRLQSRGAAVSLTICIESVRAVGERIMRSLHFRVACSTIVLSISAISEAFCSSPKMNKSKVKSKKLIFQGFYFLLFTY